jgi:hypothetical protein
MVELHLHSSIRIHGMVLNLSTGTNLLFKIRLAFLGTLFEHKNLCVSFDSQNKQRLFS